MDLYNDYSACIGDPGCPGNQGLICHAGRNVELGSTLSLLVWAAPVYALSEGGTQPSARLQWTAW